MNSYPSGDEGAKDKQEQKMKNNPTTQEECDGTLTESVLGEHVGKEFGAFWLKRCYSVKRGRPLLTSPTGQQTYLSRPRSARPLRRQRQRASRRLRYRKPQRTGKGAGLAFCRRPHTRTHDVQAKLHYPPANSNCGHAPRGRISPAPDPRASARPAPSGSHRRDLGRRRATFVSLGRTTASPERSPSATHLRPYGVPGTLPRSSAERHVSYSNPVPNLWIGCCKLRK